MKIAHYTNNWGTGGVVNYIVSLVRHSPQEVEYTVVTLTEDRASRDTDLVSSGVVRKALAKDQHHTGSSVFKNARVLAAYFESNSYDIVHIHGNNSTVFLVARIIEHACGDRQPSIIIHSHNSRCSTLLKTWIGILMRRLYLRPHYHLWACSQRAGRHLFGESKFHLIPNGIQASCFCFSPAARQEIRERFGLSDTNYVIGLVGNLQKAKNPLRALKIFGHVVKKDPLARLLVIGDGSERRAMQAYVERHALMDVCIFAGHTANVRDYYSALDVQLMPSLFEGFPLAALEAQAAGLQIAASMSIDQEIEITSLVKRISLNLQDSRWAEVICQMKASDPTSKAREGFNARIQQSNYDLKQSVQKVIELYKTYLDRSSKVNP